MPGTVVKTRFSKRLPQSDALFIMIDLLSSISCSLRVAQGLVLLILMNELMLRTTNSLATRTSWSFRWSLTVF
jgi:hypothetical protein